MIINNNSCSSEESSYASAGLQGIQASQENSVYCAGSTSSDGGVYIHIPFCIRKCNYCAFLSFNAAVHERERYVQMLTEEIRIRKNEIGSCDTIFIGGGTPSLLTSSQLAKIIETVTANLHIRENAEITIEVNPGTISKKELIDYRSAGVNRLSIGAQSMHDKLLKIMGRIHTSCDVRRCVCDARKAGFDNINLDKIFAVPGSAPEESLEDLKLLLQLSPDHVSFYSLQLEEGTPFYRDFSLGKLNEVTDDDDRKMYHEGTALLKKKGYEHYEISNFARCGHISKHNLKYWNMDEYIGFGLGASSFLKSEKGVRYRSVNTANFDEYIKKINSGANAVSEYHVNSNHDNISEAVFTGLRCASGISYRNILGSKEKFFQYYNDVTEEIKKFEMSGDLVLTEEGMKLTEKGIDISNKVMALFV